MAAVRQASSLLLTLHVHPDGDSVGSSLALARCLRALGKRPTIVAPDPVPPPLAFLDAEGECLPPAAVAARGPFDLGLFLDCADVQRLGDASALVAGLPRTVNIDHHGSNRRWADLNLIDPSAAATAELTARLIDELGGGIDASMATALYAALATDTGSFRYEGTTARTLALAARLRAAGADVARVGREVWENRALSSVRLLAAALATLQINAEGRLAWLTVTAEDLREAGATADATEGLVDHARSIRGVELALLFAALEADEVRVSLRTRDSVDASALAARFGGGGHPRAAGCTVRGALDEARAKVLAAARQALQDPGGGVPS